MGFKLANLNNKGVMIQYSDSVAVNFSTNQNGEKNSTTATSKKMQGARITFPQKVEFKSILMYTRQTDRGHTPNINNRYLKFQLILQVK